MRHTVCCARGSLSCKDTELRWRRDELSPRFCTSASTPPALRTTKPLSLTPAPGAGCHGHAPGSFLLHLSGASGHAPRQPGLWRPHRSRPRFSVPARRPWSTGTASVCRAELWAASQSADGSGMSRPSHSLPRTHPHQSNSQSRKPVTWRCVQANPLVPESHLHCLVWAQTRSDAQTRALETAADRTGRGTRRSAARSTGRALQVCARHADPRSYAIA